MTGKIHIEHETRGFTDCQTVFDIERGIIPVGGEDILRVAKPICDGLIGIFISVGARSLSD